MKILKRSICIVIAGFLLSLTTQPAFADDFMTLVVNPSDQGKSQQFIDYLGANDISVEYSAPADFDSVKTNTYITIMGGVDDEAVRKLVADAVGKEEVDALSNDNTGKMLFKEGIWAPNQKVLIFTGSDTKATVKARKASRGTWVPYIEEWFELEGPGALKSY